MCPHKLYTIGYSGFSVDEFIMALKQDLIKAVIDIRSAPYSSYYEQYNKDNIKNSLKKHDIHYLFFGDELGAKPKDKKLYSNNVADFAKITNSAAFTNGCKRVMDGLNQFPVCIMCAEKDPINCHRAILITNSFRKIYPEINILHIHSTSNVEQQESLDQRIMAKYNLEHEDLFMNFEERLNAAYLLREKDIAYNDATERGDND